jgi:hypothetical protein
LKPRQPLHRQLAGAAMHGAPTFALVGAVSTAYADATVGAVSTIATRRLKPRQPLHRQQVGAAALRRLQMNLRRQVSQWLVQFQLPMPMQRLVQFQLSLPRRLKPRQPLHRQQVGAAALRRLQMNLRRQVSQWLVQFQLPTRWHVGLPRKHKSPSAHERRHCPLAGLALRRLQRSSERTMTRSIRAKRPQLCTATTAWRCNWAAL